MNYYLHKFGLVYATATALPMTGVDQDIGPDPILPTYITLPGGGTYSTRGTLPALPSGHTVTARGFYRAANEAALQILLDAMQAWIGKKSKVWIYCADATQRWRYAVLLSAPLKTLSRGYGRFWQAMELTFELDDMLWYGDDATATIDLTTGSDEQEIENEGNQVVRDIIITVTASGSNITVFDLANAETGHVSNIRFSGTIATGKDLVIDLGAGTVKNDGTDAWNDLDRISGHAIDDLLRLVSGNNTITATRTGGDSSSTCELAFYDGYA